MKRMYKPYRAYPEVVAAQIRVLLTIGMKMAEKSYPHLIKDFQFVERRIKETELLFDKEISDLKTISPSH